MKKFVIYEHSESREREAVKLGLCWPALFFGTGWMLIARIWWAVAISAMCLLGSAVFELMTIVESAKTLGVESYIALSIFVFTSIVPFIWGNSWVEKRYRKLGYSPVDSVNAKNKRRAVEASLLGGLRSSE